jgi:hypothetical protein
MNKEIEKINGLLYKQITSFVLAIVLFYMAYLASSFPDSNRWIIIYSIYGILCLLTGLRMLRNYPWLYFIFSMAALAGGILHWPEIHHEIETIFPNEIQVVDTWPAISLFFCSITAFLLGIFTLRKWE